MNMLSVAERRRRIVMAKMDSPFAHACPALLRVGRSAICGILDQVVCHHGDGAKKQTSDTNANLSIASFIKPVGDACNLRCRYCVSHSCSNAAPMSLSLLEQIIREVLPQSPDVLEIIFHGGEPLLAGLAFFRSAMAIQKKYTRPGQVIRNHVQTNATLVTREWAQFFSEHGFFVGVSLDGPQSAHDAYRIGVDGKGSHARALHGVALLQRAKAKLQAIAVVPPAPKVTPRELFSFMLSTGISIWRVNPCRTYDSLNIFPDYIYKLFYNWMACPDVCDVVLFSETVGGLLGYPVHTCWMKGNCRRFVGFDPDGSVSPCCQMTVAPEYIYGNLHEQSLMNLLNGPVANRFWEAYRQGSVFCNECNWQHLCGGGCAFQRIQASGTPAGRDLLCGLYQDVFSRLTHSIDTALAPDD